MVNVRQPRDVAQILLSVLFLAIMIVACLWIVQPFILGFAWAGTVVIATWPVLLRLQKIMFGRRSLAVLVMTLLLVMVFIIPIALLVNSIVDGSGPLIKAISSGDMTLPDLAWLNTIPVIGAKLYAGWHNLLDMGGTALVQAVLGGIGLAVSGVPYATLLTVLMILSCLVQLGPLPVLIPAIIWLYWTGDTTWGTVLLVWSGVVGTLDNVIRPMLIRMGADLPLILILSGVIGGLIAFGMIGLFIGPVLLAVSWRLFAAWVEEVPPPTDQPEEILEELGEIEKPNK